MGKRVFFAIILLWFGCHFPARAQVPDDEEIRIRTTEVGSPYYYPALMQRYMAGDTTLTQTDYYYLYYGYVFTDGYRPLEPIPAEDRILVVFDESGGEPDYAGMVEIIGYAQEVMKQDPFSPKNLNYLVYAYGAIGDTINERINYDRMTKVIRAIESSGTGYRESSPMHVLRFDHATDVLGARGLTVASRKVVSRTTEYVNLQKREGGPRGYYFDFSRIYRNRQDSIPSRPRTWQFNNLPVKKR